MSSGKTWFMRLGLLIHTANGPNPWKWIPSHDSGEAAWNLIGERDTILAEGTPNYRATPPYEYLHLQPKFHFRRPELGTQGSILLVDFSGEHAAKADTEESRKALGALLQCDAILWSLDILSSDSSVGCFDRVKVEQAITSTIESLKVMTEVCNTGRIKIPIAFCITKIDLVPASKLLRSNKIWIDVAEVIFARTLSPLKTAIRQYVEHAAFFAASSCGFNKVDGYFRSNFDPVTKRFLGPVQPVGVENIVNWIISNLQWPGR